MSSLNKVQLIGRLGKDPEVRAFSNGNEVANFSLATSESWKDKTTGEKKEKTEWHNIAVFGPLVDIVRRYLEKGSQVYIEGKLQTRKWQDQNGNDRYSTEVVLQGFGSQLVMFRGNNQSGGGQQAQAAPQTSAPAQAQAAYSQSAADLDDDIPF